MLDVDTLHNVRVVAGTFAGFEGFSRFASAVLDPLRTLLPLAVEVEALPQELSAKFVAHLRSHNCFVDDRDLARGKLRFATSADRYEVLPQLCRDLHPDLKQLAAAVMRAVANRFIDHFEIPLRHGTLRLGQRPLVMGVLNVTPDSFSDGGRFSDSDQAIERAFQLALEGADVVDLGAESTRPGAPPVSAIEEWGRLEPVLRILTRELKVPLSIDTMKAEVADRALSLGVSIVNDVSGLEADPRIAEVAARHRAALVINHMRGTPRTMQEQPRYDDVVSEIARSLRERMHRAGQAGVATESLILDPGIGFGKRVEDNLDILARLGELRSLGRPLLIGCSRKSFLGHVTGREVSERTAATLGTTAIAARAGAKVIRVHDVRETRDVLSVLEAVDARIRMA